MVPKLLQRTMNLKLMMRTAADNKSAVDDETQEASIWYIE